MKAICFPQNIFGQIFQGKIGTDGLHGEDGEKSHKMSRIE